MSFQRLKTFLAPAAIDVSQREKLFSAIAAFAAVFLVASISSATVGAQGAPYMAAYVGAAAVLIFGSPHSPFSQPWAVIGGHVFSALIGVACYRLIPEVTLAAACAVSISVLVMYLLRCLHPPGGAAALVAVIGGPAIHDLGFMYAAIPVGLNAVVIVVIALILNNLVPGRRYPAATQPRPLAASAWALGTPRISDADLQSALTDLDAYIDISREDLNHIYSSAVLHANKRRIGDVRCTDIMTREVLSFEFGTELEEAWQTLHNRRLKGAPVIDNFGRVIGIVTVVDFLRHAAHHTGHTLRDRITSFIARTPGHTADKAEVVGQIMSTPARTIAPETHIVDLVPLFTEHGIHHLPVVDEKGFVQGMITRTDLMRAMLLVRT